MVACAIYFVAAADKNSLPAMISTSTAAYVSESQPLPNTSHKATSKKIFDEAELSVGTQGLDGTLTETPFMPKMANETLKAQLGNSAWHLLHTVMARFPEHPTLDQKSTLRQFVYLFAQVYPCGDCARHFQTLLEKYPPQVHSRKTAALWGCHIHNKVNEGLGKNEYDCTTILEDYDCGCGDDEKADMSLGSESLEHLKQISVDEVGERQGG